MPLSYLKLAYIFKNYTYLMTEMRSISIYNGYFSLRYRR